MTAETSAGKIRTVIVDDEPLARSNLSLLLRLDPEIAVVSECGSGVDAPKEIRRTQTGPAVPRRADARMRRL